MDTRICLEGSLLPFLSLVRIGKRAESRTCRSHKNLGALTFGAVGQGRNRNILGLSDGFGASQVGIDVSLLTRAPHATAPRITLLRSVAPIR